ncbi:MAG: Smr/MutS family protein [Planctomycetota bacterium]
MARKRGKDGGERRRAENRYAHLTEAQAVFDFHGRGTMTPDEIRALCRDFLRRARAAGHERVRIITGKGRNSAGAPVVKPTVLKLLAALEREGEIRSHRTERQDRGGDGALFIEL